MCLLLSCVFYNPVYYPTSLCLTLSFNSSQKSALAEGLVSFVDCDDTFNAREVALLSAYGAVWNDRTLVRLPFHESTVLCGAPAWHTENACCLIDRIPA